MDSNTWLPVATLVLGAALGYVAEWHKERRGEARDRRARRVALQRQAIVELVATAWALYQGSVKHHVWARVYHREAGQWPTGDTPVFSLAEEHETYAVLARLRTLLVQIDDRELRDTTKALEDFGIKMLAARSPEQGDASRVQAVDALKEIEERARILLAELN
jgi:hypothetical protein